MSKNQGELHIRRILVALDASPHSLAALDAAVDLASRFEAELSCLFVEDVNLLRLAELPFAQEVGLYSAARRPLDPRMLERQMRSQTARVHRIFSEATELARVRRSFRVARGAVASEVLTAAMETDVLILGKAGWSLAGPARLGSTARKILSQALGLSLILQHGRRLRSPVLVVYDGSPLGKKALIAAATLVHGAEGSLTVLLLTEASAQVNALQAQADACLRGRDLQVRCRALLRSNVPNLARIIETEECGTLVLPTQSPFLQDAGLQMLLDETDLPVLLVGN